MANRDDDWPEDWEEWLSEGLELEQVPLETPDEEVTPIAFRAYFDEVGAVELPTRNQRDLFWLMTSRLRAFELLGTNDLETTISPTFIEWRVRVA